MNCDHCGKPVNLNAKFCGKCGAFLNMAKKIQAQATASKEAPLTVEDQTLASAPVPEVVAHAEQVPASVQVLVSDESVAIIETTQPHQSDLQQSQVHAYEHKQEDVDEHEHEHEHEHEIHGIDPAPAAPEIAQPHSDEMNVHIEFIPTPSEPQVVRPETEAVNIEQMAPVLNNPIPHINAELVASLVALHSAIDGMRSEMDAKVADIKGDVHATAQALAQKIQTSHSSSAPVDLQGFNASIDDLKGDIAGHFGELKEFWASSAQTLVNKNSDDMQAILSAEFKKIQTGIVNLYNTQQNNIVKSAASFDEAIAALTFKIQNIENFVNAQLASQAQAQSSAQTANRTMATAVNEIRAQLQTQQELLSGLTIDPALIKTMNSFNINFRKQQEQLAAAQAEAKAKAKPPTPAKPSVSISDSVVMWFVGFLCGLTILLGGFSVYNYYAVQAVKTEHKKKPDELSKEGEKSEKKDLEEKDSKKSESDEAAKVGAKEDSKTESESTEKSKDSEKDRLENKAEKLEKSEKSEKSEKYEKAEKGEKSEKDKSSDHSREKNNSKSSEREKGEDKASEKNASKKRAGSEKEQ